METILKDIHATTNSLFDFRDMYEYENRLKTFTQWPFKENCKCTPENMASAGFIQCPNTDEPDVVKCFFCLIELEGWEPNDDPWQEHAKRSNDSCGFLSLSKNFDDLTVEEYYEKEMERVRVFLCKTGRSVIHAFEKEVALTRKRLVDHFVNKYEFTPDWEKPPQTFLPGIDSAAKEHCVFMAEQKTICQNGEGKPALLTSATNGNIGL
nr:baculoviral IAP repeat-containing protein 5.1-like [Anolis sagrei ordinatus]